MPPPGEFYFPPEIWHEIMCFLISPAYYRLIMNDNLIPPGSDAGMLSVGGTDLWLNYNQINYWVFLSQPPFIYHPGKYPNYKPMLSNHTDYDRWWFSSKVYHRSGKSGRPWRLSRPYQLSC